jgi:type IV pilus assembly protein PilM
MRRSARHGSGHKVVRHDGHAIGLDLGATSVRAAALTVKSRDGDLQVLTKTLGGVPLAPGTVVNGEVLDRTALTSALKKLWRTYDIGSDEVILGVANPEVLVRELRIPDLDPDQRARALPFQARDVIAMPLDQVVLDFAPLGEPDPDTHLVDGLLVASPREPVVSAIKAVEAAGLTVVRVDLSSFAVLRSSADGRFGVEVVIDLGAHLTTIVVHEQGVPKMVRTLARGGEVLTANLAKRLAIGLGEAEDAKCVNGLDTPGEVSPILKELVAPLLADIRSSVNYFRTSQPGTPIERVSLTGRAAALTGLDLALAQHLDVPAQTVSPTRLLEPRGKHTSKASDEGWASALSVGLAMGAAA